MNLMRTIHHYDVNLFFWVMRRKSQRLQVRCARWLSRSGDGYLYAVLAAALAFRQRPEDLQLLSCMATALLIERSLYFLLKNVCRRDRPQAALNIQSFVVPSDRFSFPSGHTSAAFLMAGLLSYFHPLLTPFLLSWATLVGMARVVLGVHFPTDTMIGAVLGTVTAIISLEILLA